MKKLRNYCQCQRECGQPRGRLLGCASPRYRADLKKRQFSFGFASGVQKPLAEIGSHIAHLAEAVQLHEPIERESILKEFAS